MGFSTHTKKKEYSTLVALKMVFLIHIGGKKNDIAHW
jgi:hypothetical protein